MKKRKENDVPFCTEREHIHIHTRGQENARGEERERLTNCPIESK